MNENATEPSTEANRGLPPKLHGQVTAFAPIFRLADGEPDETAAAEHARWLASQPVAGVVIWSEFGELPTIDTEQQTKSFQMWRSVLAPRSVIICAVGCRYEGVSTPDVGIKFALEMAEQARTLGADAILAYPPTFLRSCGLSPLDTSSDADQSPEAVLRDWIADCHRTLASAGLPVISLSLGTALGGMHYDEETIDAILTAGEASGLCVRTHDSIISCQEAAASAEHNRAGLLLTAEDRFLGYSLMCGAGAIATYGAAAFPGLAARLLEAWHSECHQDFANLTHVMDRLTQAVFRSPVLASPARLRHCLAWAGVLPPAGAEAEAGSALSPDEAAALTALLDQLRSEGDL